MRKSMRKPSLKGRGTASQHRARAAVLVLGVSVLLSSLLVFRPGAAQARTSRAGNHPAQTHALAGATTRLDLVNVIGTQVFDSWSNDEGATWAGDTGLGSNGSNTSFTGTPAVVSIGVGQLSVIARDTNKTLWDDTFSGPWSGWTVIPGVSGSGVICIGGNIILPSFDCYEVNSDPAVASWGPGRMDLFVNALDANGGIALLHTWADNGTWSGNWEVLGDGLMQGNPAAVSWGTGRVDVFVRGGGNELDHKWFDNGQWSSNWENLGGDILSSPTVASDQSGDLSLFALNASNGLTDLSFGSGVWQPWVDVDSNTMSSAPSATAEGPGRLDVFALNPAGFAQHTYLTTAWSAWTIESFNAEAYAPAVTFWVVIAAPPPPTPTPMPTPRPTPTKTTVCHPTQHILCP